MDISMGKLIGLVKKLGGGSAGAGGSGGIAVIYLDHSDGYATQNRVYKPMQIPEEELQYATGAVSFPTTKKEMDTMLYSGKQLFIYAPYPVSTGDGNYAEGYGLFQFNSMQNNRRYLFTRVEQDHEYVGFDLDFIVIDYWDSENCDIYGRNYP